MADPSGYMPKWLKNTLMIGGAVLATAACVAGSVMISIPLVAIFFAGAAIVGTNHIISTIECAVADSKVQDSYSEEEAVKAIEAITGEKTVFFHKDNVEIKGSNKIRSRYKRIYISKIIQNTVKEDGSKRTNRSTYSLAAEWFGHNFLSDLNIMSASTDDVNLDYNLYNNEPPVRDGIILLMMLGCL